MVSDWVMWSICLLISILFVCGAVSLVIQSIKEKRVLMEWTSTVVISVIALCCVYFCFDNLPN